MQANREFHRSAALLFALTLSGCKDGVDDVGEEGETAGETTSSESTVTSGPTSSAGTSSDTGTDTSSSETDNGDCELNDIWEPNSSPDHASLITWQSVSAFSAFRLIDDAYLCPAESDWYRFDVESLGYTEHYLYIRALVEDAGLCGASCGEPEIPAGPEHAMTIEVFRADTMALVATTTDDDGVVPLGGWGEDFTHDLLIHVFSPTPKAEYPYRLSVEIRNYDGEDECEC